MSGELFNPFLDRLSRDLRNDLSEGLAEAILSGSTDRLSSIVASYRRQPLAECYRRYLEERCAGYDKALDAIRAGITEPIHQGLILWDLGLFFEVHEILEHAWYKAEGARKLTLQALIRAAGVYIKREYGFADAAARIAEKALPVLEENRALLAGYCDPDRLIEALRNHQAKAPTLLTNATSA